MSDMWTVDMTKALSLLTYIKYPCDLIKKLFIIIMFTPSLFIAHCPELENEFYESTDCVIFPTLGEEG